MPHGFKARPTTDFAREGLFNVLANTWEFEDLAVLDLFAGTGSIGFEFASRGAGRVDMVEKESKNSNLLHKSIASLSAEKVRVIHSDVLKYIRYCSFQYDIIFADPPYDLDILPEIPDRLFQADILEEEGWFILEHGSSQTFSSHTNYQKTKKYGSVHFSFFTNLTPNLKIQRNEIRKET